VAHAVEPLFRDDDAPPESGVRVRLPASFAVAAPAVATRALPSQAEFLAEVTAEVFFEVWDHVKVLSPLQGAWLTLDVARLGEAVLSVAGRRCGAPAKQILRDHWPELVPGFRAMDRLASLMVDALGDWWHVRG
jgi:hypothetical protein